MTDRFDRLSPEKIIYSTVWSIRLLVKIGFSFAILFFSSLSLANMQLQHATGPGATAVVREINQICNRPLEALMDETLACPESSASALIELSNRRNQSIVNSVQAYMAELPPETRSILWNQCQRHRRELDQLFKCYNEKVGPALWRGLGIPELMPSNVSWKKCQLGRNDSPPRIVARLEEEEQKAICETFATHLKNAKQAYQNLDAQQIIRSGVGITCSIAKGQGRIVSRRSGTKISYRYQGTLNNECFPQMSPSALQVPMPYAPRMGTAVPGGEGSVGMEQLQSHQSGLWSGKGGYPGVCHIGFNLGQDGRERSDYEVRREVCPTFSNYDPTGGFSNDIFKVLHKIDATDFFELLRIEALARTIRAARIQLGNSSSINTMPESCGPVASSYQNALSSPLSTQEIQQQQFINQNPEYIQGIQTAARRILNVFRPEVRSLESEDSTLRNQEIGLHLSMSREHILPSEVARITTELTRLNNRRKAIEERLNEIEAQIGADFSRYPVLMIGREHDERLWNGNPEVEAIASSSNLNQYVGTLNQRLARETTDQIDKICSPRQVSDEDLASDPELSAIVLARYPRFKVLHQCIMDNKESRESTLRILRIAGGLGCAGLGPIGGAVCGGLIAVAGGYMDYERAQTRLSYQGQCRMVMGSSGGMCNTDEYIQAREAYNDTLTNIAIDGALEIILPVSIASIKYLSPSRIRQFKVAIEGAQNQDDIRRIAREMEEAAEEARSIARTTDDIPTRIEGPQLNGVVDDIPTTRIDGARARRAGVVNADPPYNSSSQVTRPQGVRPLPPPRSDVIQPSHTARLGSSNAPTPFRTSYELNFPEVRYRPIENPIREAETFLNSQEFRNNFPGMDGVNVQLTEANQIGKGGTRRVFSIPGDNRHVVKVYDPELIGISNLSTVQKQEMISSMIQRELAIEDLLLQTIDDYRRAGLEPPFAIARINRNPELLSRGIIVQERYTGQTLNTLTRQQLDELVPPPSGYTAPTTTQVTLPNGKVRTVDEFNEYVGQGGLSHREIPRIPGVRAYQDFLDQYDSQIRQEVIRRTGLGYSTQGGPNLTREFGVDIGNGYGNVMLDPDGPGGQAQVVIYDW